MTKTGSFEPDSPFSRARERDRKIAAIRSAAARRFNRWGVRGSRLEDIAADLGLTKTSIAYYYASKEALVEDVFLSADAFLEEAIEAANQVQGTATDRLYKLFEAYANQVAETLTKRRPHAAWFQELDVLSEEVQERITRRLSDSVASVNQLVSAWHAETGEPLGRTEPATYFIFGLLDWMNGWPDDQPPEAFKAAAGELLKIVDHGIAIDRHPLESGMASFGKSQDVPQIFDREARNRMKREAFLRAGTRYFNSHGYEGVSLAEVAASLGVTRGAFYYHIPDKEKFLDQCFERSFETVEGVLDDLEQEHSGLTLIEHLMTRLIYQQASGVTPLIRPGLVAALPPPRQKRLQARLRNISRRLGDALELAIASEASYPLDTEIVEKILTSVMFLNGGYTIAAANLFSDWRMSEDPYLAAKDYMYILLYGLKGGS